MKTIYIPKGETIRYESLATEHLVVHGCLQVTCGITAKTITGYGTVHAGTVNADVIRVDDMDAGSIVCKRLLAKRVQSPEVFASESAAVSCFLSSAYVETGKLTVIPCILSRSWEQMVRIFWNGIYRSFRRRQSSHSSPVRCRRP